MSAPLSTLDFINGLFSLLVISVGAIIGVIIALKYLKFKRKIHLYWGIAYIGFYSPWWSSAFSFVLYFFIGPLPDRIYIFIGIFIAPFILILWLLGFTEMIYEDKRKSLIVIYSIILAAFEVYIIYFLIVDPRFIGEKQGIFDIKFSPIIIIYWMLLNFTTFITGIIFAKQALKSEKKELRFKSIVLIIAFLTYPICGISDAGLDLNEIGLIIVRSLLMFGAIMFYIGFFEPKFIKKIFHLE